MFTLDNFIYIYNLDKFCVLPTMPDTISDVMSSTFQSTTALSRSAPVWSYANSGPRTVSFTLDLHRDIMEDINTEVSNLKDNVVDFTDSDYVDILLNHLQACALPKYSVYKTGSKVVEPPQVAIKMGNDIFVRGIINGSITVAYQKPILDNGKYASVKVTFSVTEVDPYDAPTVAMTGGFRGVTATFKSGIYKDDSDTQKYSGWEFTTPTNSTEGTTLNSIGSRWNYDNKAKRRDGTPINEADKPEGKKNQLKDINALLLIKQGKRTLREHQKAVEDLTTKYLTAEEAIAANHKASDPLVVVEEWIAGDTRYSYYLIRQSENTMHWPTY